MREITAAVVEDRSGRFRLTPLHLEDPRPDEALVRIVSSGLCHTDLAVRAQTFPAPLPMVLGHEGSGVVESVGAQVEAVRPGDHVVLSFAFCETCDRCRAARPGACRRGRLLNFAGTRADGTSTLFRAGAPLGGQFFGQSSFAEYAVVRAASLVPVPPEADLTLLGPLACSVATGAGAVFNTLGAGTGHTLAVFGVSSVGLCAVMAAKAAGCAAVIAVGRDRGSGRLAEARQLGATEVVDLDDAGARARLARFQGALDFVVETTGAPALIPTALATTAVDGACALVGLSPVGTRVSLDVNLLTSGRTIRGCVEGESVPARFIPQLLRLHQDGRLPFDRLITRFPFDAVDEAAELLSRDAVVKPVLVMPPGGH